MKSLCTFITNMEFGRGRNMILDVRPCVDEIFSLLGCYVTLIGICADVSGEPISPIFKNIA